MTRRPPRDATLEQAFTEPQHVRDNRQRRAMARRPRPCGEGVGRGLTCDEYPAVLYARGLRCERHAPSPVPPKPDPERTLDGLRRAAGLRTDVQPGQSTVLDDRAEASGKRVSVARRAAARDDAPTCTDEGAPDAP